jgi:hypothetical protein
MMDLSMNRVVCKHCSLNGEVLLQLGKIEVRRAIQSFNRPEST